MPAWSSDSQDVVAHSTIGSATAFSMDLFRGGRLINRSGGSVVLDYYECERVDGTYVLAADVGTGGRVTIANNQSQAIPTGLQASRWLKLVKTATSATLQLVRKD